MEHGARHRQFTPVRNTGALNVAILAASIVQQMCIYYGSIEKQQQTATDYRVLITKEYELAAGTTARA